MTSIETTGRAQSTSTPGTVLLGISALAMLAVVGVLGLIVTGPDLVQGDVVRLIYVHPAVAWVCYLAFGICALGSALWLLPATRHARFDQLAGASAEVGVVFCVLTLATGAIWGRPTWGVWWTWDARLTTTAVLLATQLGYLALRRVPASAPIRRRRNSIAGLIAFANVPLVHMSVEWWRTLHQGRTLLRPDPEIGGLQLTTMLLSIVAFTLVFAWMLVHRFRIERLEEQLDERILDLAFAERMAESDNSTAHALVPTDTRTGSNS